MNCTWGDCNAGHAPNQKHRPRLGLFAYLCDKHSAEFESMSDRPGGEESLLALMKARGFVGRRPIEFTDLILVDKRFHAKRQPTMRRVPPTGPLRA